MILADERERDDFGQTVGRATLDDLFRRAVQRRPDAPALLDAPNRRAVTGGAPRQLTYREADRVVSAIAGRLRRMGLATDTIVAIQLPNTVDATLTLLGVLRAGMIPMPIPLLWRRAEAVAALGRVGAKVLVTAGRVGEVDHGDIAMHVAAELFMIRYVCGFGDDLPDGIVPLDDLFAAPADEAPVLVARAGSPAAHVALVTWDVTPEGPIPVARSHAELLAGGVTALLESRIEQDAAILAAVMPSSFASIALTVVPWLLVGGTLALHHPFDPTAFAAQRSQTRCSTVVLPGPLAGRLAEAGLLGSSGDGARTVIGLWRAPERVANSVTWPQAATNLVDVHCFGEIGLIPARRAAGGRPAPVRFGILSVPMGSSQALSVLEVVRTVAGTVALRGPMIPRAPFPPDVERSGLPHFKTVAGFADTLYPCRVEGIHTMVVTGPPTGLVGVGGYRFAAQELQELVTRAGGRLAPLPDSLCGQRLAGAAENSEAVLGALAEIGVNALVLEAFREKRANAAAVSAA